jgi:hypothetical protein
MGDPVIPTVAIFLLGKENTRHAHKGALMSVSTMNIKIIKEKQMEIEFTTHATGRKNHRGIQTQCIRQILRFGDIKPAKNGAYKLCLEKKDYNRLIDETRKVIKLNDYSRRNGTQSGSLNSRIRRYYKKQLKYLEKARNGNLIIIGDRIITLYRNH